VDAAPSPGRSESGAQTQSEGANSGRPPGVVVHHAPPLHPDDVDVVSGIPCTSIARTLVDCAEMMPKNELRELFASAQSKGMLDTAAVRRSAERVEWRPSLPMLYEVIAEFSG
jgi:hypothetical protein